MSGRSGGRGRGRSGGRGGRGSGGRNNNNRTSGDTQKQKSLKDYMFYLGSAKQASDFETTAEYLINHIKGTYDYGQDIATALTQETPCDMTAFKPTIKVSRRSDADAKAAENRQFEIEFKEDFSLYRKREQTYKNNTSKAYAFLWSHCTKSMQSKLEACTDFESSIKENPIELLKAIKQHALNYQEHRYEMSIILDAIRSVVNCKQRDNESLHDYTRRFKTARDV